MTQRFFWLLGLCAGLYSGLSASTAQATQSTNCDGKFADLTKVAAFADSGPARLKLLECLLNEQHQLKHNQTFNPAWDEEGFLGLRMNAPVSLFAWRQKLPPADSTDQDDSSMSVNISANTQTATSGGSNGRGKTGTKGAHYSCTCGGGIKYVYQPKTGTPETNKYDLDDPQLFVRIPVDQIDRINHIDTARLVQAQSNLAQSYGALSREPYDTSYVRQMVTGTTSSVATIGQTPDTSALMATAAQNMTGAAAANDFLTDPCGCPDAEFQAKTGINIGTKFEIDNVLRGLDHIAVEAVFPGDRFGFDGTLRLMIKE